ncbi:MAG: hypothetical protein ACPGRC_09170 [Salibacteraceae bacterium]
MIKKWYNKLSIPKNIALLNAVLIAIIITANIFIQAFCIPSNWAIGLLIICFANTIIFPLIENCSYSLFSSFINGLTFSIFIYCVVFLEHANLFGLIGVLIGIGIIVFIPHFFIVQLLWKSVVNPVNKNSRIYFGMAVILALLTSIYIGKQYEKSMLKVIDFKRSGYKTLDADFMTEKILGMHFIYHTRYSEFDGWRPPKHEPFLVIGLWLNDRVDPLNVDLNTRMLLYQKFFPNKKVKFSCSCALAYKEEYHKDSLWKN